MLRLLQYTEFLLYLPSQFFGKLIYYSIYLVSSVVK